MTGYNVYRALYTTSCGSFAKINAVLNTTTLYTDHFVDCLTGATAVAENVPVSTFDQDFRRFVDVRVETE